MANIYVITNKLNGMQYVGATAFSIRKRFKEHCRGINRIQSYNRPLYRDMREYGVENFDIELLEECDDDVKFDREVYWIEKLDTYKNGYNLTFGGAGKHFFDYSDLSNKYLELGSVINAAKFFDCDVHTVRTSCKIHDVEITHYDSSKSVDMLSKNNEPIETFHSFKDAAEFLLKNNMSSNKSIGGIRAHIIDVCNGKRKSAYGFKWRYSMN